MSIFLPKSGSGKVMWRTLQEREQAPVQAAVQQGAASAAVAR